MSQKTQNRSPRGLASNSVLRWVFLGIFTFFVAFPLYWMIMNSFKTGTEAFATPPTFLPMQPTVLSYVTSLAMGQHSYGVSFRNFVTSIVVCICTVVICIGLSAPAAYSFSRARLKGSSLMLLFVLLLRMVPPIVIVVPLYSIMRTLGLIDTYPALIIAFVALNMPFAIWLLKGFYDGIPRDLVEAGMLDGCTHFGVFFRIFFPLSLPGLTTGAILVAIGTWNDILVSMVMAREKVKPVSVGLGLLDTQFDTLWAQVMATSVLAILPVIFFAFLVQKNLVRGLTMGAVR